MTALPELRAGLIDGVRRAHGRRRRRRRLAAASTTFGLAALALAFVLPAGGPDRALAIEAGPEVVELRIADFRAGAQRMTRELQAAGIDGEVRLVPVKPERVGTWVIKAEVARQGAVPLRGRERRPEERIRLREIELTDDVIRIPVEQVRDATGRFVFYAGRAAQPGEPILDRPPLTRDVMR